MKQLKEHILADYQYKGKKVVDVETPISFQIIYGKLQTVPFYEVKVTIEEYKNPQSLKITMTFCPACGQRFLDEKPENSDKDEN